MQERIKQGELGYLARGISLKDIQTLQLNHQLKMEA